jgi:SAM-dependent methyltransferase
MKAGVIESLICPACKAALRLSYIPDLGSAKNGQEIEFGVAACDCRKYPIVFGILIFKELKHSKEAIDNIINSRTNYSLEKTVMLFMEERVVNFVLHLEIMFKRFFGRGFRMTFWKLATFIENSPFATYAKYRFSCPSLISAMPFFPVVKKALSNGDKMLDLGCGMGHLTYMLSRHINKSGIYCADISFRGLYFARRYLLGTNSNYILLDANTAFPFTSKSFKVSYSMDALPFIHDKKNCANEMGRITKDDGLILFIHIHNKLVPFIANGLPLTPKEYVGLFDGAFISKLFSEKNLMKIFFSDSKLDLRPPSDMKDVDSSDAISLLLSKEKTYFTQYEPFFSAMPNALTASGDEKFILNPLYRKRKDKYVRVFPASRYEEEYYLIKDFFPVSVDVSTSDVELKKKLIMIPVPKNYTTGKEQMRFHLWR